ncbi:MAG: FtsQ-type POTRA domain-containing protein [Treponema sp.]|jgi:cell division protein FtsQ|nr:FtsQ-type POTRA domain-containing protein [Treponema sp.]
MADNYMFEEEIAASEPKRMEKVLKVLILFAVLVIAVKLIWLIGITPFRPLSRIDIAGYSGINREQVIAAAGITSRTSFFSANARSMEQALAGFPTIQSVRVFRHFPDRLLIVFEGRTAVAASFATIGGRTVPVFFDNGGVIFRIGGNEGAHLQQPRQLPIVSGITIENPYLGMRLPPLFGSFFRQLEHIGTTSPELLAAISEIRVNPQPFDGFDLILYPVHRRIRVRINELNEDTLRYTLLMVDVLASREPGIESIDFRSSIAWYVLREASF